MKAEIIRLDGESAWELIYADHLSSRSVIEQEAMKRAMTNSSRLWLGLIDNEVVALWGLIPPTFLSDKAYLWLFTTKHFTEHTFVFIRHSQRVVQEMLREFPIIVGHGQIDAYRSLRWLRWLGAEFGEPEGTNLIRFEIKAKTWQQDSVQSA